MRTPITDCSRRSAGSCRLARSERSSVSDTDKPPAEICDNLEDDDLDELADCADPDCAAVCGELADIRDKALSRNPSDRYQTAAEFASALARLPDAIEG